MSRTIMVTGGLGFIGSNLIRYWMRKYPGDRVVNVDAGTYAARPGYLEGFLAGLGSDAERYRLESVNIQDQAAVQRLMSRHKPDHVLHLAAESHVCRSISGPRDFVMTNIVGTWNLLEEFTHLVREHGGERRFLHVSTDEVFGELGLDGRHKFNELYPMAPRSPYAASKASSDLLVQSYVATYGIDAVVTNCTNNFGPNQHEEKLIPKTILRLRQGMPVTLYGTGEQVRDWLYVQDHCEALDAALHRGLRGERYCIGGENELNNRDIVSLVYTAYSEVTGVCPPLQIKHTEDRPTDDLRYAVDTAKIRGLGWAPDTTLFLPRLRSTVQWYLEQEGAV